MNRLGGAECTFPLQFSVFVLPNIDGHCGEEQHSCERLTRRRHGSAAVALGAQQERWTSRKDAWG